MYGFLYETTLILHSANRCKHVKNSLAVTFQDIWTDQISSSEFTSGLTAL